MELRGREVFLRPVRDEDADILTAMLAEPSVAHWWPTHDHGRVATELLRPETGTEVFVIETRGKVVGLIQVGEETDPEFRHATLDLFLTTSRQGHGLGPDAIRTVVQYLVAERGHHRITIDPAIENTAAVRAYEKVGFRPVGRLRRYQRLPDGKWIDGLLMDLLADELIVSEDVGP